MVNVNTCTARKFIPSFNFPERIHQMGPRGPRSGRNRYDSQLQLLITIKQHWKARTMMKMGPLSNEVNYQKVIIKEKEDYFLSLGLQWSFSYMFHWIQRIRDKNICHYNKRARTCHLLCKKPGCYHSTSKTHVRDRIFNMSPIHASVIYQKPNTITISLSGRY